ncbi:WxL protein peptidoglycan domain-containing protein [Lacticaseibacillus nasuensis]|uniref:WxL protein peptidoglycan domain-containing protein n=1 Tax=Lacticaseibacillus nasuensis TaxID=944671 RepID=UPI001585289E
MISRRLVATQWPNRYTPNGPKDSSAEYRLSDLGPKTQTITLSPNETKRVSTPIKIPQSGFKGVLLGGLYMYDQKKNERRHQVRRQVEEPVRDIGWGAAPNQDGCV